MLNLLIIFINYKIIKLLIIKLKERQLDLMKLLHFPMLLFLFHDLLYHCQFNPNHIEHWLSSILLNQNPPELKLLLCKYICLIDTWQRLKPNRLPCCHIHSQLPENLSLIQDYFECLQLVPLSNKEIFYLMNKKRVPCCLELYLLPCHLERIFKRIFQPWKNFDCLKRLSLFHEESHFNLRLHVPKLKETETKTGTIIDLNPWSILPFGLP